MPIENSEKQNELVRELTQMQKEDSDKKLNREDKFLDWGLLVGILITGGMLFFANYTTLDQNLLLFMGGTILFAVISLILGILGFNFSRLTVSFGFFFFSLFAIFLLYYIHPFVRELIVYIYALFVFSVAAQYKLKGFIAASTLFIVTEIYFVINQGFSVERLHSLILTILIVETIGLIPVLLYEITKVRKETRLQQLRLQILALQNQDLVNSWQEYFTRKSNR